MTEYIRAVRALLDELNRNSASGLITREALILMGPVETMTRELEREARTK